MEAEVRKVGSHNAFCIRCYVEATAKTHEETMEIARLSKGTRAMRITVGEGSRARSNFLCMTHAKEFRDMVIGLLEAEKSH